MKRNASGYLPSKYVITGLVTASALAVFAMLFPHVFSGWVIHDYPAIHAGLELLAIVPAFMIFVIGWYSNQRGEHYYLLPMAFAFFGVGLLDTIHLLSFPGMPNFVTPASTEKGIVFWLGARALAAVGLLALLMKYRPLSAHIRKIWVALVLLYVAAVVWVGLGPLADLPRLYIAGSGLTPLKVGLEYALVLLFALAAFRFWRLLKHEDSPELMCMFASAILLMLAEVFFTLYRQATDAHNLLGHVYKAVAHMVLLRCLVLHHIRQPYFLLRESEQRLTTILDNVSAYIYLKAQNGQYLYVNKLVASLFGVPAEQVPGTRDGDYFEPDTVRQLAENDSMVLKQGQPLYAEEANLSLGERRKRVYWTVKLPLRDENNRVYALCGISTDITDIKRKEVREANHNRALTLLTRGEDLQKILTEIVLGVESELPGALCSILMLDLSGRHLLTGAAPSLPEHYNQAIHGAEIGLGAGSCGTAAFLGERVVVADVMTHPYWVNFRALAESAELRSCWSQPIKNGKGQVIGTFAIYHREPLEPAADEIALIEDVATLAGLAIEQSRAQEALQLASLVYQGSSEAMMITSADAQILTINPAFTRVTGYTAEEVLGQSAQILQSPRLTDQYYRDFWATLRQEGRWEGEIWNRRKNGEDFPEWITIDAVRDASGRIERFVALFSDISEKKQADERIWRQANFDLLTGLPNRSMFQDRLQLAMKSSRRQDALVGILLLDLDHFKEVNDSMGHEAGDELLKQTAVRLGAAVRETDTVARLGGDEFIVILNGLAHPDDIERIALDILQRVSQPYLLGRESAYVSASIGITLFPNDADTLDGLLKNADQAMYEAKKQGRNRFQYFTPAMQSAALLRARLASDLHTALAEGQLFVHYQPIVHLASGEIRKAEALLRWQHPELGLVSPAQFIPIAEDTGLITPIGNWVLREAIQQVREWRHQFHPDFQISVNKSPLQFHQVSSLGWPEQLAAAQLPADAIVMEITEGLLLEASQGVASQLNACRQAGMQIALDDFGTGYSAMAYLKHFDMHYLKIDQSFVRNLQSESTDMALCEAMIVMAHKLSMEVIAEGVETEEQRNLLLAAGCDYGQGYWFSRPVPPEILADLLSKPAQRPAEISPAE